MSVPDKSKVQLSSPDVRADNGGTVNPFWPELAFNFPIRPKEMSNWAELIHESSEFLNLFDEENNNE